jgi:hypothetical protein
MSRQPPRRPSNCLATEDPVCNREATGETLDLRELPCRCNLEYRFAYADESRSTDRDKLCCASNQPGRRIVDIQTELFTFDSCKMAGVSGDTASKLC